MAAIFALYCIAMPGAFLAGEVYRSQNQKGPEWLPYACALIPPMGAVIAIVCLTNAGEEE